MNKRVSFSLGMLRTQLSASDLANVKPSDMAKIFGISVSRLKTHIRWQGYTWESELDRARLARYTSVIVALEGDPLPSVGFMAGASGFKSPIDLCVAYKRWKGFTYKEARRRDQERRAADE